MKYDDDIHPFQAPIHNRPLPKEPKKLSEERREKKRIRDRIEEIEEQRKLDAMWEL